jgi:hypothetical protein
MWQVQGCQGQGWLEQVHGEHEGRVACTFDWTKATMHLLPRG